MSVQHHVCDQPVPLQGRRSQRQLLCLSHGGVCSCASRLATSSDGQRRARDKRARVPGFAARKKNLTSQEPQEDAKTFISFSWLKYES